MVGLERVGPTETSAEHVCERLRARYGPAGESKASASINLGNVRESEHLQAGGPHRITIIHAFYLIAAR
jgi:hypothetical protein